MRAVDNVLQIKFMWGYEIARWGSQLASLPEKARRITLFDVAGKRHDVQVERGRLRFKTKSCEKMVKRPT